MTTTAKQVTFTARQREIVRYVAAGLTYDEIGEELSIHHNTARAHALVLMKKLGVEKRRLIPQAFAELTGEDPWPRAVAA